jgi:hypothetical protein
MKMMININNKNHLILFCKFYKKLISNIHKNNIELYKKINKKNY